MQVRRRDKDPDISLDFFFSTWYDFNGRKSRISEKFNDQFRDKIFNGRRAAEWRNHAKIGAAL